MNKEDFIIKDKQLCLGDVWANKRVEIVFKDIDLENDRRPLIEEIYNYVKYLRENCCHNNWLQDTLNIDESKKLNAIMKCKNKEILKKKICKFYYAIQQDQYDWLFHPKKIKAWQQVIINIQEKEHLWKSSFEHKEMEFYKNLEEIK